MRIRAALFLLLSIQHLIIYVQGQSNGGQWKLVKKSIGISAMHMALLPNGKIIAFDRTDFGVSNISLPGGKCRHNVRDQALTTDCSAHSVEFDPSSRNVRPLTILTDTWCSSGALSPDGRLVQSGGFNDGDRAVRYLSPCHNCDWVELQQALSKRRWYASNQILPEGDIITVGGRGQFNYEFIPTSPKSAPGTLYDLPFLRETLGSSAENNLYPFLHLLPDGNLFVFANTKAILLDYKNHRIVRTYPEIPSGDARNYPSTGSSVLLPLVLGSSRIETEVLVCGGAPPDSNAKANVGVFVPASKTCGRLRVTDISPKWVMEEMPLKRVLGDMILLPTGDVLIINGAAKGSAGWGVARDPVKAPVLYQTGLTNGGKRSFKVLTESKIPRLYHSTAHLLPDGRVLVGGSNPNIGYEFANVLYPTELSLQSFSPPYLSPGRPRPKMTRLKPGMNLKYKSRFAIEFESKEVASESVYVTMVAPSFTTHSYSMNQRLLVLDVTRVRQVSSTNYAIETSAPATAALAPPGHYLLFVVHGGVPSPGNWVHIS